MAGTKLEEVMEILVPVFDSVEEYTYDAATYIARLSTENIPFEGTHECVEYMREVLVDLLPKAQVVDSGGIYLGSRNVSLGWWIQFKL